MPIPHGILGKVPSGPKNRVRNFIANKEWGRSRISMRMSSAQG